MTPLPELPAEVLALIDRAMVHPAGFRLLYKGNLESIAVLFEVHPSLLTHVRELIADPATRPAITEALTRAKLSRARDNPPGVQEAHSQLDARGLLQALKDYPDGEELLLNAPTETVAVLFDAHPFVVDEARSLVGNRGAPASDD
jgi:inosine-uridine nucleoside N-ribohydrolase